jgi:DNA-binding transcriptional LysR family regulator
MVPLYSEPFVIAMSPTHPLARLSQITIHDLEGHNYLSRINCEYRDYIKDVREAMGVSVRRPYSSERYDWIQCMVMAGMGFTVIPEYVVSVPDIATRPLVDPEFIRNVGLVTVRGRPHTPAVGAFVHECRRYPWIEKMRAGTIIEPAVTAA